MAEDLIKTMIKIQKSTGIALTSKKWYNFIEMIYFSPQYLMRCSQNPRWEKSSTLLVSTTLCLQTCFKAALGGRIYILSLLIICYPNLRIYFWMLATQVNQCWEELSWAQQQSWFQSHGLEKASLSLHGKTTSHTNFEK